MDLILYLLVVVVGFIAGFINTLAGSGSLLTLPVLIFMGLDAGVANGTNRIAILLQSIVGVGGFKQKKVFEWKDGLWLTIPSIIGVFFGSMMAVNLDAQLMNRIIGVLLVVMFLIILFKPEKWVNEHAGKVKSNPSTLSFIIFFAIGFYGGFIQVGVGFFLLTGLVLGAGYDLLKANAIKVFIVLVFTIVALGVFIYNKQVNFLLGFILGVGSMFGAWVATHIAVKRGVSFIRWFLLVAVLAFAVKMLFF
ncbi:MAG: sulfite exporter TauE/SafE family protein [Bacteroidales bacterium]|nr:MAG: sulfite exporter TauE/SafE family protein [Bacteroidales bacterium]